MMTADTLRIASLIPSATEIIAALGLTDALVARSHECDYPLDVLTRPVCTAPKFDPVGTSAQIHDRVSTLLETALSVYKVHTDVLAALQPTHIVTQAQCEVCAVSLSDVEAAVATLAPGQPQVISLQPTQLSEVWDTLRQVGQALLGEPGILRAEQVISQLQGRFQAVHRTVTQLNHRPTVVCIEWSDPLMAAGNWVPELVTAAGGIPLLADQGHHSPWLDWEDLQAANPDRIILMPCGYSLAQTIQDSQVLTQHPTWATLKAVQTGQVYATDGNQYFNRPGPRLTDSLEILAEVLHPGAFTFGYEHHGWVRLTNSHVSLAG